MVWDWIKRKATEAFHGVGMWAKGARTSWWHKGLGALGNAKIPYLSDAAKAATLVVDGIAEGYDWANGGGTGASWNPQQNQDVTQGARG